MARAIIVFASVLAAFAGIVAIPMPLRLSEQTDPVSVLEQLFKARNSAGFANALALFADDGVIVNVVGAKFVGRDSMEAFVRTADAEGSSYATEAVQLSGDAVVWTELVVNPVYEKLGVAPVRVAGEAVIRNGRITSFVTHFPPTSLAKFEGACEQKGCEPPKADGVLIVGQPCLRFLANAWAQTRSVTVKQEVAVARGGRT